MVWQPREDCACHLVEQQLTTLLHPLTEPCSGWWSTLSTTSTMSPSADTWRMRPWKCLAMV